MQDTFHKDQSEPLTDNQKHFIEAIKTNAQATLNFMNKAKDDRLSQEVSDQGEVHARFKLAQRALEEAVMWAVKGITIK